MWKQENTVRADDGMYMDRGIPSGDRSVSPDEITAFVGRGVDFKGVITYSGTVRIDGSVDGEIHADGGLLVGEEAVLTAKVTAGSVVCQGSLTGDIETTERLTLCAPAVIKGSLKTPLLSMEEGVIFNGTLEMAPPVRSVVPHQSERYGVGAPRKPNIKLVEE
jgi:cytoskeletal protein CcmA (bactofilin family)